ncbi:ethanolamine ammonia-lyase light chain [Aureimonas endophytica]|uniref:Ethanolamine ammonia-lyase small subunit n=1 Tax=Aureimonas endophytica TaxID=2027858 RepID=A0A917E3N9_9HYPH|nr:ethanolamine ammonia-lyase subunit EutC [Aureimonas endophytica]GGD99938.1 ethanolamine ammonia-lyase light chain [Aureimonas endophytica]
MSADRAPPPSHPIAALRRHTAARIGLGRAGAGLPTAAHLDFAEAHARARDAVHAGFAAEAIEAELLGTGRAVLRIASAAPDRPTYLRRPDLGRRLGEPAQAALEAAGREGPFDLALIAADGLSAHAANLYAAGVAADVLRLLPGDWRVAPILVASQARVALSDPAGAALKARLVLMLIGERPGLSAADSLGAYLTFAPEPGRTTDADRNCVSNIREGGLPPSLAAPKLARLLTRATALGFSGTRLKDEEDLIEHAAQAALGAAPESR